MGFAGDCRNPRASQALLKLEHLLVTPPKERMPCMVLHGDSNIRKTLIVATLSRSITPTVMSLEGRSLPFNAGLDRNSHDVLPS